MDIDKLFLSGLNYKTEGVENIYGYVEQHLVKESELTEEHQLQNKIIDMYLALLIDKKDNGKPRNVQILHRSIDNDTDLAKSVLKDIEGSGKSKTETPYSFYSLARQTASKNDYITGKVGIGPFALNNNNQILTMIYHISFREFQSSLLSTLGLSRLDKQLDVDGNSIMSWISAMINAHVDIAKDPWISRLNVNPFSYNITNLLLRTGWGGNTFYFLTQPIMKQMADAYVKASSQYMQQNGSTYSRQQQSIKDVAEQYFGKDVTFDGNTLDDALSLIDAGDKESIQAINKAIKKLLESEQFKQDARDYAQGNDVADQKGLKSRQLGIYLAYVQFSKYANALANLVKYCKIDTKKHGKSAAEQLVYKEGFDELFEFATDEYGVLIKKGDVGALFEPAGLLDLVEHSYVGTKTRNAISLTKVILGVQFMSSTTGFIQMLRQLNTMAGNTSLSVSFVQSAQKALSAAIKSEFFNDYASRISDNPRYMHDLVNSSSEDLEFSYDASTNSMSITGNKHSLKSYVGQPILLWYKDKDGNLQQYIPRDKNGNALPLKVLTAKDDKIQLNISINGNFNGVCRLLGGANTIFDRLSRLKPMIYHNNDYSDLQGNLLLEMLIPGKRVEYSPKDAVLGERPDTYDNLKFVKLQNFVDDGGINTNYIINAWNELLEYQNDKQPQVAEYIRDFARDLIVYAFITSGDTQGFTKMFKYVPASWRKKSGYADFINRKLVQLNSIPTIDLNDVLLNNWYDNKLVPTYQFYSKDANGKRSSNFIGVAKMKIINGNKQTQSAYPTILAALKKNDEGMYEPSIAVESSPKFIKIPRSYNHYDSQRQYNVYQLYGFARHNSGIMYPVYVLVQPKGTKVSGGFMVTEYGRDDSTPSSTEYVVNQGALRDFVESADFINQLPAIKKNFGDEYAAILNDLRTEQTGGVAAAITDDDQAQPVNTSTDSSEKSVTEQLVQHLKDSGFTVYDTNGNVDENNFETEGVQFFQKKHYLNSTYKSKLNSFKQAILSNKYTQAGVDFLKVDDLYILFEHASHSETIDSIEKGSAGFGLIDVFDSEDNIDYAEISRLMSINYQHTHDEQYILNSIKRAGIRITDNIRNQVNSAFYKSSVQFAIEPVSTETDGYEQRLQSILDKAPRDSKGRLLAPNGKPSNLPERLYAQVRTKEFKDWFGDWQNDPENASKVVDENGEPRIVYHGSNQYGFDVFDPSHSDDKISLFASSSKWIASTYTNFQPLENTLVRKALLKGNAIDLIKNEDWKSLEKLINSVIDSTLPRPEKYGFPLPYGGSKKALDEVLAIQKELDNPNLTEEERYSLLADLTKAEDKYYYSGNYTFKVEKEDLSHGKTRIKISIDDSYSKRLSSFYTEEGVIFRGSPEELIESLTFETKVYDLFFNIKNPLILDNQFNEYGHANNWNNLDFSPAAKDVQNTNFWGEKIPGTHKQTKTRDVAAYAKKNNYDGVIFKRIADRGGYEGYKSLDPITDQDKLYADMHVGEDSFNSTNKLESDIIIAFNSNQVKSAGGENTTYSRTNNNIHFFKDSKGVVYGYVDDAGIIHLNKSKISPEHPIHEYTHIWDRVVALKIPSLWIRGVELMKQFNGGKLWNEIANSEFYGKKWSNMSDAQREFMIASEVHARLVGESGAKLISEIEAKQGSSDIISKLKDWILKFWQSLKQTFSNWSKEDIEALTLKDFNHMTLRDFVTSNAEVAYNESDAPLSTAEKLRLVGLVKHDYEGDINVDEEVQRAIDKLNAISPNEQRYITPVITGKSVINGVSLIDAINIAAKIYNSENILGTISNKSLREKIQQTDDEQLRERLYNISDLGAPNEVMFMIADYISYNDARGIVANYICDFLENIDDDTPYDDIAIPIIKSIDVKYDDSRQQSLFSDDIMKHCKGN